MIIRGTARLLTAIGIRRGGLPTIEPGPDDWYANVHQIGRQRWLLLTHASTLFTVFVPRVSARDLAKPAPFLAARIAEALAAERLPPDILGPIDAGDVQFAVTASRTVLGQMNDLAYMVEANVVRSDGLAVVDAKRLNRTLRRLLRDYDDGTHEPIEVVRRRLPAGTGEGGVELVVELHDLTTPVWRRITIPGTATLDDLDHALKAAFDWSSGHLSAFWEDERWRGTCYMDGRRSSDDAEPTGDVLVVDLLSSVGDGLVWVYDFGDEWRASVTVTARSEATERRACCIGGAGAAPPQDCGGPPGYDHLLEVLANPRHPEHEELTEWVGGPFDPTAFDLMRANARVAAMAIT